MKTKVFFNKILWACVALFLSLFCVFQSVHIKTAKAEEATVIYTDVMTDLQKDENFNPDDYPAKADDYSLQVIQIAESVNNELFVYVYQPSNDTKDLVAIEIRLAMVTLGVESEYRDYLLTLLSTNGVFDKYKVENLTIVSDLVRGYEIVQVSRPWDSNIDKPSETDNTVSTVPCEVSQKWTAQTIDGNVFYSCIKLDVVRITSKWLGSIRYDNGFFGEYLISHSDAWFVAFSTSYDIDRLINVTISYDYTDFHGSMGAFDIEYEYDEYPHNDVILTLNDYSVGSNAAGGLFAKKYKWLRILSKDDFLADNGDDLTDDCKTNLKDKQWILRFLETDYDNYSITSGTFTTYFHDYSIVEDVTFLEMTFEVEGEPYHLGVVDNKQTPDTVPDGDYGNVIEEGIEEIKKFLSELFTEMWGWLFGILLLGGLVIVFLIFAPWIFVLVGKGFLVVFKWIGKGLLWILKLLWRIICLPFKLIGKLFKRE